MPPIDFADPDIGSLFRHFTSEVTSSPLYSAMCPLLGGNTTAISLYEGVRPEQRRPNLLFAAIHASILRDPSHELGAWYPTVGGTEAPTAPALGGVLDRFLEDRHGELHALVATGATQTNEVGRTALILPAVAHVHSAVGRPLGLVEIGTSAGLNLRLDAYRVSYRTSEGENGGASIVAVGPADSSVHISCDSSRSLEPIPVDEIRLLEIGSRKGADLNPLDVTDAGQARWLRALIWPDELERFERLTSALAIAPSLPVDIVKGDASELVAELLLAVKTDLHPVLLTTWVLTYLSENRRVAFVHELDRIAAERDFTWVCIEHPQYCAGIPWPEAVVAASIRPGESNGLTASPVRGNPIVLHSYQGGQRSSAWIATAHPHGRWINWHPSQSGKTLP